MSANVFTTVFLPIALAIIMFGLGLSLLVDDFRRVVRYPRAVVVGLTCQVIVLPIICWLVAVSFGLVPAFAVGLMLLAASPGGTSANLYSHIANGDVALNITLTAVNTVLAVLTLPIIVNLSLVYFYGDGKAIPLQFSKVAQIFALVLIPVALGMIVNNRWPSFATSMRRPVKILSIVFLVVVVILTIAKDWASLSANVVTIGGAALAFNLASLAIGYFVPRLLNLGKRQAIAIGMEIGVHNGTLAIAVALSPLMLNNSLMAIPPAIYSVIMFFTAALFGWLVNLRREASATTVVREG